MQNSSFGAASFSPKIQKKAESTSQEAFLILGTLGAGKTTLLLDLADYLQRKGEKIKLIVNDIGKFNIDGERLTNYDPIKLTQGCICCDSLDALKTALLSTKESGEMILIEPTGIADGKGIKNLIAELGMQSRVLTLVNSSAYPLQSESIKQVIQTQSQLADVLAFSHLGTQEENQQIKADFSARFPQKTLIDSPFQSGKENLKKSDEAFDQILESLRAAKKPQLNYTPQEQLTTHQKVNTLNLDLPEGFSYQHLEYLIKAIGEQDLLRMKGVITVVNQHFPFDYVKGRKNIEI